MAEPQGTKRTRTNTVGDARVNSVGSEASAPQAQAEDVSERVKQLSQQAVLEILTRAAQMHPDVMFMVDESIRAVRERERNRVIDFDYYSKSVWKSINVTHSKKRGSAQYEIAFDVAEDVVGTIKSITRQCGPNVSAGTRLNGLSVLRKIGKTIALSSGDVIAHEVQKQFQSNPAFVDGMYEILESMEEDEVRSIRDQSDPEKLYPKLQELQELAADCCIFEGMEDVLAYVEDYDNPEGDDAADNEGDEFEDEDEGHEENGGEENEDIECISVSS